MICLISEHFLSKLNYVSEPFPTIYEDHIFKWSRNLDDLPGANASYVLELAISTMEKVVEQNHVLPDRKPSHEDFDEFASKLMSYSLEMTKLAYSIIYKIKTSYDEFIKIFDSKTYERFFIKSVIKPEYIDVEVIKTVDAIKTTWIELKLQLESVQKKIDDVIRKATILINNMETYFTSNYKADSSMIMSTKAFSTEAGYAVKLSIFDALRHYFLGIDIVDLQSTRFG